MFNSISGHNERLLKLVLRLAKSTYCCCKQESTLVTTDAAGSRML
jgi:hypothetical protein